MIRLKSTLFGDYMVSMPYFNYGGAVAETATVEESLMRKGSELAEDLGCQHIEFRDTLGRNSHWTPRTDKVIMELALPTSVEELWSRLGSNIRRKIRRPQKEGAEILRGGKELVPDFYRVFSHNMRDLGTPVYPECFFASIMETFPDSASIVVIRLRGKLAAAALLLGFKNRLQMPWVSSIREFNRLMINMLLYWELLENAIENRYQVFDFGRSTVNSGTYYFKKQWGAKEKQLYWHYWLRDGQDLPQLTPNNAKYQLAIKAWQRLPLFIANRLGPRIVKNLP